MRAKGAHKDIAQGMPMSAVWIVAAVTEVMKKVEAIHAAKRKWERSHARRRVSQGIWRAERRRLRRAWRAGGVGREEKDVKEAERSGSGSLLWSLSWEEDEGWGGW